MRLGIVAILLPALLLFACNDEPSPGAPEAFACTPVPQPTIAPVEGLIVPPSSHIYRARPTGQKLILVRGYVDMTPVEVRKFYEELERDKRYEFFLLEDEVIEAEAFFTYGKWRNYIRARTDCEGRSELFVFVAPEDYGEGITPRGQTSSP